MRCKELAIRTAKTEQDDDEIELTVPFGGKDLKVLIRVGAEVLWIRDVEGALAGEGVVLRFDEHVAFDKADTEPAPEAPPSRQPGDWTPPAERPLERVRRTEDGTYPNVGEELAKVEERARVGAAHLPLEQGVKVGYGRGVTVTSERSFDPDLPPHHPHNQEVAREKKVSYDQAKGVYRDSDGCPTHDKFGQRL